MSGTSGSDTAQRGFTLIELMVAMAIFALVALMSYAGLSQVINARIASERSLSRLSNIQFALRQIEMDLEQLHPRPVREEFGDSLQPAVLGDLRRFNPLEFTRAGWRNPLGTPRSSLQRVAYRLEDGKLIRSHWNVLDRIQPNEPLEFTLLENIEEFDLRFMKSDGDWLNGWPDPDAAPAAQLEMRPRAIEIVLQFADERYGSITRLIEVLR